MSERTFLQFRAGSSTFGVAVTSVVEIVRVVAPTPVPDAPPDLLGVVDLRGRVVPVFDLCKSLKIANRPISLRMYIIIVAVERETIGILVDDVLDVATVAEDGYQDSRALTYGNSFTAGIARVGLEMVTVLNFAPLLDRTPTGAIASET